MPGRVATSVARRLGGPTARRRRHRRVALAGVVLAAVAGILVVAGSGSDEGDAAPTEATLPSDPVLRACAESDAEIDAARGGLLRDNDSAEAVEGFLGDAFVDLARDRATAIRATDPSPEVLAVLEEFDAVVDAIEADPSVGVGADPFAAVNDRWRDVGLAGCVIGASTVETS